MGRDEAEKAEAGGIAGGEKISRSTLEEAAGQSTLKGHGTPEERFWQRQQSQAETISVGRGYIAKVRSPKHLKAATNTQQTAPKESKKEL
jgi:anoctamin-10